MKLSVIFLLSVGLIGSAFASIETTPFDLQVSSGDFFESGSYHPHLIILPDDSGEIMIQITNDDSQQHTISLFMAKETPHPDRNFVFEPEHLTLEPGETGSSALAVSSTADAGTGTTTLHTIIAQSTTFGTKSFGFYLEIAEEIVPPSPEPELRRGGPGTMFSSLTQFGIDESKAFEMIPFEISMPYMPEGYSFQGTSGSNQDSRLIYSKGPVSESTYPLEFWDGGGLLIDFEKDEYHTFEDHLTFLNPNEQQVKVHGKDGISSSAKLQTNDGQDMQQSRVVVFLGDDIKMRLKSQMSEELLLKIAASMLLIPEPEQDKPIYESCGPGTALQDGICVASETKEGTSESGSYWGVVVEYPEPPSPLKQIKSGVKFHNVECKDGLELAYKKSNDTSACVTLPTKIELVIRGWAEDDRVLLGCTPTRHEKCYPSDPLEYRKAMYDYYFDDSNLPSSKYFDFVSLHAINRCSDQSVCFGKFDNGTKMRISCDYPMHGCPPIPSDEEVVGIRK